jgi:ribosomal protein S4
MRLNNKYKIYSQSSMTSEVFHQRLFNFKRPKWKKIQKNLIQIKSSKRFLSNSFCIKNTYKVWDKIKNYYKQGVKARNNFNAYFDNSVTTKHLTTSLKKSKNLVNQRILLDCLIKPEYRVDILLWRLKFFNSSYQARQAINNKLVLVNGKYVAANLFLRRGDLITFIDSINLSHLNLNSNRKYLTSSKTIFTFVEVDFYTNTIIIVKDLSELNLEDIHLLNTDFYDLKKIKDFI